MKENITILNIMLGAGKGGLESVFVQHALAFKKMGYRSVCLCLKQSPYQKDLVSLPTYTIDSANLYYPKNYINILKIIHTVNPNIICLHGNRAISFLTSRFIRPFLPKKIKLVATTHNIRNKRFSKLDRVMAISRFLMSELKNVWHIPEEKIIYCTNTLSPKKEKPSYIRHHPVTIGALRRLEYDKGLDVLLEACRLLKQKGIPFKTIIAGDGSLKDEYVRFCKKHFLEKDVVFLGWISSEKEKDIFFNNVDIFCMPSRAEGLPIALLEACNYAKPSVVSALPGPLEVINTYHCGIGVEVNNAHLLADALEKLINDKSLCEQMSHLAYQTLVEHYSNDCQFKWLEEMIQSCLKQE